MKLAVAENWYRANFLDTQPLGVRDPDFECEVHFNDGGDDNYGDGDSDSDSDSDGDGDGDIDGDGGTNCW